MALTDITDVQDAVNPLLGDTSSRIDFDSLESAITQAMAELHWSFPIDDAQKEYWVIERTKRYALYVLLVESAHKFQFKKIYLQQRFANYFKLIEFMDKEFLKALDSNPTLFDVDTWGNLTFYITNGFNYNSFGEDESYDSWD